jgi:hypothetical protein
MGVPDGIGEMVILDGYLGNSPIFNSTGAPMICNTQPCRTLKIDIWYNSAEHGLVKPDCCVDNRLATLGHWEVWAFGGVHTCLGRNGQCASPTTVFKDSRGRKRDGTLKSHVLEDSRKGEDSQLHFSRSPIWWSDCWDDGSLGTSSEWMEDGCTLGHAR